MIEDLTSLTMEEMVDEYRKLKVRKAFLEKNVKAVSAQLSHCSDMILKRMVREGETSTRTKDGATVSLRFDMFVNKIGGANSSRLIDSLRSHGLDYLISFSPQSLKSYIKERMAIKHGEDWASIPNIDPREELPEDIRDMFTVYTELKAIVRGLSISEEERNGEEE